MPALPDFSKLNGALLINKHAGVSSFGVIETIQRQLIAQYSVKKRDLPKLGHGGTLDPFATGLLPVLCGRGVKLARYFLGSTKTYEGIIRFGETTVPGDPTEAISERSDQIPESLERIQELATRLTAQPYLQTPPMHSAKKLNGKPLYELARQGIEVEREPKSCTLHQFEILGYENARAPFRLVCSSGTYVRTLAQDLAKMLGSVALLETLTRTSSGSLNVANAWTTEQIGDAVAKGIHWDQLPCWMPFDRLLSGYASAEATAQEANDLFQGRQAVLFNILKRASARANPAGQDSELSELDEGDATEAFLGIYCAGALIAVARREPQGPWGLERVFTPNSQA